MSLSTLEGILETLPTWVAWRRLEDLETNTKFLHFMPFNGDYTDILRNLLSHIFRHDDVPYGDTITELGGQLRWPETVTQAMIDFLRSYTPVTDEELRLACWRYLNKDSVETLNHCTFKNLRRKQPDIIDNLIRIYGKPEFNKRAALNNINLAVANMNEKERECLYFKMTEDAGLQYLSSDIERLVARCNPYVGKQVLVEYNKTWHDSGPEKENIATCLGGAKDHQIGTMMSPEYTAELTRLIQTTKTCDIQRLSEAVNRICARLAELPRLITRNYRAALKSVEDLQFGPYDLRSEICKQSTNNSNGNAVFDVIYDVESACKKYDLPQYKSRPHVLPKSLLEAPNNILIDIHNALIYYLEGQQCFPEGDSVAT